MVYSQVWYGLLPGIYIYDSLVMFDHRLWVIFWKIRSYLFFYKFIIPRKPPCYMFGSLSRSRYLPGYVWSPPSGTSAGCRRYLHLKTLFAFFISSTSSMDWSGVALESDEGAVGPLPTTISYLCACVRLLGYSTHKKRCGDRL